VNFHVLQRHNKFLFKIWQTEKGLIGYVDSDCAADLERRRSLTGNVFTVGSCAVSWRATCSLLLLCQLLK